MESSQFVSEVAFIFLYNALGTHPGYCIVGLVAKLTPSWVCMAPYVFPLALHRNVLYCESLLCH